MQAVLPCISLIAGRSLAVRIAAKKAFDGVLFDGIGSDSGTVSLGIYHCIEEAL